MVPEFLLYDIFAEVMDEKLRPDIWNLAHASEVTR